MTGNDSNGLSGLRARVRTTQTRLLTPGSAVVIDVLSPLSLTDWRPPRGALESPWKPNGADARGVLIEGARTALGVATYTDPMTNDMSSSYPLW